MTAFGRWQPARGTVMGGAKWTRHCGLAEPSAGHRRLEQDLCASWITFSAPC